MSFKRNLDMYFKIDDKHPRGTVLAFTLIALVLMGLLGTALIVNTQSELEISMQTSFGRDTFNKADSVATISVLAARALVDGETAGDPSDLISAGQSSGSRPPFKVELMTDFSESKLLQIQKTPTIDEIKERYLIATFAEESKPDSDQDKTKFPHVRLVTPDKNSSKDIILATAAIAIDISELAQQGTSTAGYSNQDNTYDDSGGNAIRIFIVVSANGRTIGGRGSHDSNYFGGSGVSNHSIVTTIYQAIIS